jgi:hypothetical protein
MARAFVCQTSGVRGVEIYKSPISIAYPHRVSWDKDLEISVFDLCSQMFGPPGTYLTHYENIPHLKARWVWTTSSHRVGPYFANEEDAVLFKLSLP